MSITKSSFTLEKTKNIETSLVEVKLERYTYSLKNIEQDAEREAVYLTIINSIAYSNFQLKYLFSDENMDTLVRSVVAVHGNDLIKTELIKSYWDYLFETYYASFKISLSKKGLYSLLYKSIDTIDENDRYTFDRSKYHRREFNNPEKYTDYKKEEKKEEEDSEADLIDKIINKNNINNNRIKLLRELFYKRNISYNDFHNKNINKVFDPFYDN